MCDIGSRIKTADGKYYYLTDADVREYFANNPGTYKDWSDFGGHSGIELVFGRIEGERGELYPFPAEMVEAVNRGERDELHAKAHKRRVRVEVDGDNQTYREDYLDGKPAAVIRCKNGKLHGLYEAWDKNGQQRYRVTCRAGDFHGLYEAWYKNGQQRYRVTYRAGELHGLYEWWDENGQFIEKAEWKNGIKVRHLTPKTA